MYETKRVSIKIPPTKLMTPNNPNPHKAKAAINITKTSLLIKLFFKQMGEIMTDIPRMSKILAMLLPIALPMAISGDPSRIALIETVISGIDVPNPMITELTSILEILRFLAMQTDPLTKNSPPKNKANNPAIMINVLSMPKNPHSF